jgi:phosphonate transport system permease protein
MVFGILYWSALGTGATWWAFVDGLPDVFAYFGKLVPTRETLAFLPQIAARLVETVKIALAASAVGSLLALPFALLAARNLAASRLVYGLGRSLLNFVRTVPDLILATLLAAAFGLGPLPGVLALTVFTFGVVAKLLADTVETIDPGPLEAVAASGGTRVEQAVFAVLPQVAPDFVAYALYAFEINVRSAAVLGLVGAGGIGMTLITSISLFQYKQVGLIIAATFAAVFLIDALSTWLRSKLV